MIINLSDYNETETGSPHIKYYLPKNSTEYIMLVEVLIQGLYSEFYIASGEEYEDELYLGFSFDISSNTKYIKVGARIDNKPK